MPDLQTTADLVRACADPSRLRLLSLLAREELTVAELVAITSLAQPRVSTHLKTLRSAGLVRLRRSGTSTFHVLDEGSLPAPSRRLWESLRQGLDDALLDEDVQRLSRALSARGGTWADSVAGRMERHYAPGRTWEAAARVMAGLGDLGHVLDIASGDGALSELVAGRARSVTCLDLSPRVAAAARARFASTCGVHVTVGDMHDLPFAARRFHHVLLVNTLSYARDPARVVGEAARVLAPGGQLVAAVLRTHRHAAVARQYDHVHSGFEPEAVDELLVRAGLAVEHCAVTVRERRAPHLQVITAYARRPRADAHERVADSTIQEVP